MNLKRLHIQSATEGHQQQQIGKKQKTFNRHQHLNDEDRTPTPKQYSALPSFLPSLTLSITFTRYIHF